LFLQPGSHGLLVVRLQPRCALRGLGRMVERRGASLVLPLSTTLTGRFAGRRRAGLPSLGRLPRLCALAALGGFSFFFLSHRYLLLGIGWPERTAMRSTVPSSSIRRRTRVGAPPLGSSSITFE